MVDIVDEDDVLDEVDQHHVDEEHCARVECQNHGRAQTLAFLRHQLIAVTIGQACFEVEEPLQEEADLFEEEGVGEESEDAGELLA